MPKMLCLKSLSAIFKPIVENKLKRKDSKADKTASSMIKIAHEFKKEIVQSTHVISN